MFVWALLSHHTREVGLPEGSVVTVTLLAIAVGGIVDIVDPSHSYRNYSWGLYLSGILRSVEWQFNAGNSGQLITPIFTGIPLNWD
jgi:hypothetical protein